MLRELMRIFTRQITKLACAQLLKAGRWAVARIGDGAYRLTCR
jgi:hypothetical protein